MSSSNANPSVVAPTANAGTESLNTNPRTFINDAIAAILAPAKNYIRMRIFPLVMWTMNLGDDDNVEEEEDFGGLMVRL